ncbi:g388 [Coccomyxa elongata]
MEPAGQPAQSLSPDNPKFPQKVRDILHKAQSAWLKNTEVCDLLLHYAEYNLPVARDPPNLPPGGSLFLFDRRAVRFFRKDGHNWRKKADGKTVRETHEKLKVGNVEMLNCYYAHADTEEGAQQATRLQRRCYWLLESEDDIVLVHYLNIDKAKGKTEDLWTSADPEMARRPGFTVTSGGVHGMQGLGPGLQGLASAHHAAHALLQPHAQHHQQHPVDPYIPLMPSLSLDSFFGAYDERDMAAQRAQAPPPMMENVLPAWEDLSNGPSNSLQAGADWRSMLRGDSLSIGLSEGVPAALVEHGANMMMIEQGAQQPEGWAQDVPVAMRTPSLEARQAQAAAMMRQNAELQQRQSSLERRAAYQKSLLAANRDQMQQAAAAAMLQQAQSGQANGMPYNLNAFHQRLLAAARQGPPNAGGPLGQGQMPGLGGFRPHDAAAAQAAALAGMAGQLQPPQYNQQMPPPPPPQRPFMAPTTTSGAAAQAAALAQARLPPLQQGPGFQGGPSAGAVPADWARAYREQQHKAAQAAIARSAKWGTTEPPLRPVPLRQGSAPGPLDATPSPSGSAGPSPGKPPLAATEGQQGFPKMSKLDALLMQQQQQQQNSGSSSGGDAKQTMSSPGALGTNPSVGSDQMLHHASSAGQLGAIGTQVKLDETTSEGTSRSRVERQGSKVAKALALEAQLRSVDGAVMEQLQSARSISDSGPFASLDSKVQKLEEDLDHLEASSRQLLQESVQDLGVDAVGISPPEPATSATHTSGLNHAASGPSLELQDFSPEWDFTLGGSKVIVTCREGDGEVTSNCPVCIMFDKEQVPAVRLQVGVYRCHAPPHEAGTVGLCITYGDGRPRSNVQPFTYRATPQTARAQDDLARAAIPDRDLQLRLIHMLMGASKGSSGSTISPQSPSNSSDSNTHKQNASPSQSAAPNAASIISDLALEENPNALQSLSDESREKLLQTLLERRLKQFTLEVREGRAQQGPGWSPSFAVNQRAQSGLALVHILAALGYDWGLQLLIPLGALLNLQDAWGRTALHWAAAYACEATVVLLLVRGAQPSPLSHGGEAQPRVFPADMAAGNGHAGIAAFLSEQALLRLAKDKNVALDDSADARMEEQGMSLRKRARSLRRADSASELPLLREAMAAPEGASKPAEESEDEGTSPKELLAQVKKIADCVRHALARAACRRAAIEQTSLRRQKKEGDAMARIESSLQTWQQIQQVVERGIQQSNSDAAARRLVRLGQRISCINACLRDAIKRNLECGGSSTGLAVVDEVAALPLTASATVVDYGSDSDVHVSPGERRRSLIHLRESRRRDSITKIKGLSDASIRQFLARGREGSKADEGGPSQLDIRDLRSLSLSFPSFSVLGPPIGVSLPDSDLRDLRNFISAGQSFKKGKGVAFGSVGSSSSAKAASQPAKAGTVVEGNPEVAIVQKAVSYTEALAENEAGHAQYLRLRQAYTKLTTTAPWGTFKQARRGSLSYAV